MAMLEFFSPSELHKALHQFFPEGGYTLKPIEKGLLNQNILVERGHERFLLKVYRPKIRPEHLERVHAVMKLMHEKGIPGPELKDRATIDGKHAALYSYLPGHHPNFFGCKIEQIQVMGDTLGRIHAILNADKASQSLEPSDEWRELRSLSESLEKLAQLEALTRERKPARAKELLAIFEEYREWLKTHPWDQSQIAELPAQLCHGDFHTKNVLFEGNRLTAVLDWEKYGWWTQSAEVMRSIVFNCRRDAGTLDWHSVETYVHAYRQHRSFTKREAELAFPFIFQKMISGTWAEEEYLAGREALWDNVERRNAINRAFVANYDEIATRIAQLLAE